jgi:hypothetical protein
MHILRKAIAELQALPLHPEKDNSNALQAVSFAENKIEPASPKMILNQQKEWRVIR